MTQETLNPIVFAPAGFRWAGEIAEGLPIVSEPDGSICEPLLRFFGWSFRMRRVKISSMRDEAYTLREWWSHLRVCGVSWEQATDQTMIVWREALKRPSDGGKAASPERINRKLAIVFEFYLSAKQALLTPYDMVGPDLAITPRRDDPTRWSSSEKSRRNTIRRKTPDIEAVGMVLAYLRNTAVNPALKDRNWLIGRTMADAGLRRDESSRLGRRMILDAIFKEGMRSKGNAAGRTQDEHQAALETLDRLEARSRTNIYVRVVGKGDVVREAPFPIALVRDLLTILGKPTGKRNQDWLFVSDKTGARLSAEAIGNMMLDAFDACGIDGSGHRLRAHFATKLAERLWAEEFANNGFRWDQRVENLVLDRVAEALGHASPTTSCRHYLDLGRMAYFRVDTKSALKAMRSAVSAMADNHRKLPTEFFDRIRMLLERRASGVSALDDIIDAILADPDYAPEDDHRAAASRGDQPKLKIV